MAANRTITVLKDIAERIDGLEITLKQLDAAQLIEGGAEAADLAEAHTAALQIASKLTKAASEAVLLYGRIDRARRDPNVPDH
jgi:cupin superfamily acireductone dioxygenase involved in methionine salvage